MEGICLSYCNCEQDTIDVFWKQIEMYDFKRAFYVTKTVQYLLPLAIDRLTGTSWDPLNVAQVYWVG